MIDLPAMCRDAARGLTGHLECSACGKHQPLTEMDSMRYLATGWPMCCGYTMSMVSAPAPRAGGPAR